MAVVIPATGYLAALALGLALSGLEIPVVMRVVLVASGFTVFSAATIVGLLVWPRSEEAERGMSPQDVVERSIVSGLTMTQPLLAQSLDRAASEAESADRELAGLPEPLATYFRSAQAGPPPRLRSMSRDARGPYAAISTNDVLTHAHWSLPATFGVAAVGVVLSMPLGWRFVALSIASAVCVAVLLYQAARGHLVHRAQKAALTSERAHRASEILAGLGKPLPRWRVIFSRSEREWRRTYRAAVRRRRPSAGR